MLTNTIQEDWGLYIGQFLCGGDKKRKPTLARKLCGRYSATQGFAVIEEMYDRSTWTPGTSRRVRSKTLNISMVRAFGRQILVLYDSEAIRDFMSALFENLHMQPWPETIVWLLQIQKKPYLLV